MISSFAKVAGVAGMTALVTAVGLGFGAGTAQAKPKPVVPKPGHTTTMTTNLGSFGSNLGSFGSFVGSFQTNVDNFIDSTYPNGEMFFLDPFSDVFTPLAK
jgi:hypothetical protein